MSISDYKSTTDIINPFDYCGGNMDSSYMDEDILSNCCGSKQKDISGFSKACQKYFQNIPESSDCNDSVNLSECIVRNMEELKKHYPLETLCENVNVDEIGSGSANSSNPLDKGYGRGCFLCKFCDTCGASSGVCGKKGELVKMPSEMAIRSWDNQNSSYEFSNVDMIIIGVSSILILLILFLCIKNDK